LYMSAIRHNHCILPFWRSWKRWWRRLRLASGEGRGLGGRTTRCGWTPLQGLEIAVLWLPVAAVVGTKEPSPLASSIVPFGPRLLVDPSRRGIERGPVRTLLMEEK
jgi:hypothetical protein